MIVVFLIIAVLITGFIVTMSRQTKPNRMKAMKAAMDSREPVSSAEYLHELRIEAKGVRCPHPGFRGNHGKVCHRAAGRPCVRGCRGRIDISTDWHG